MKAQIWKLSLRLPNLIWANHTKIKFQPFIQFIDCFLKSHWCMHNVFLFVDVLCWKLLLYNSSIESNVFTIQSWICQSIFVLTLLCFCLILFLCFTLHYFTLHCWTMLLSVFFLWFLLWSFSQFLYLNFFVSCWYSFEYLSFSFSLSKIHFSLFLCRKTNTNSHTHYIYLLLQTDSHSYEFTVDSTYTHCVKVEKLNIITLSSLPLQILCHWIAHDSCGVCVSHSFLM